MGKCPESGIPLTWENVFCMQPLHGQNSSGTSANKPSPLLQAVFSNSKVTSNLEDSKVRIKEKKRADGEELSRFGKKADAGDNTSEEVPTLYTRGSTSATLDIVKVERVAQR